MLFFKHVNLTRVQSYTLKNNFMKKTIVFSVIMLLLTQISLAANLEQSVVRLSMADFDGPGKVRIMKTGGNINVKDFDSCVKAGGEVRGDDCVYQGDMVFSRGLGKFYPPAITTNDNNKPTVETKATMQMDIHVKDFDSCVKAGGEVSDDTCVYQGDMAFARDLDILYPHMETMNGSGENNKEAEKIQETIKMQLGNNTNKFDDIQIAMIADELAKDAWKVDRVQVEEKNEGPVIKIKAKRLIKKKLFGFIPITVEENAEIDIDMNIKEIERPLWRFLAW